MSFSTKLFMMLGKLQRAHPTLRGHFVPAYLIESDKLREYHIYSLSMVLALTIIKGNFAFPVDVSYHLTTIW